MSEIKLKIDRGIYTLPWGNIKVGRPWLAKITGLDSRYRFEREFASTIALEWEDDRPSKVGISIDFFEVGAFYEGSEPRSWRHKDARYYFKVIKKTDTEITIQTLSREEVFKTFYPGH
jgi:hypothetical protein